MCSILLKYLSTISINTINASINSMFSVYIYIFRVGICTPSTYFQYLTRGCEAWGLFIIGIEVKSRERERNQCYYAELSNIDPTSFRSMFNGYVQLLSNKFYKKKGGWYCWNKDSQQQQSYPGFRWFPLPRYYFTIINHRRCKRKCKYVSFYWDVSRR